MNKNTLVKAIAEKADIPQTKATLVLDSVIASISETLAAGDNVVLPGFGTFEVRERAARQGRNPQTGATIEIAASKNPAFKAGKNLKEAVN